jgi:hypothetical protein
LTAAVGHFLRQEAEALLRGAEAAHRAASEALGAAASDGTYESAGSSLTAAEEQDAAEAGEAAADAAREAAQLSRLETALLEGYARGRAEAPPPVVLLAEVEVRAVLCCSLERAAGERHWVSTAAAVARFWAWEGARRGRWWLVQHVLCGLLRDTGRGR